ncbi:uncharacterized protein LOC131167383 [Malania oleifera]|uniref:uncharacterized protein LOC131167383 n=1 Tax=Malania oleifera TaxID=397392 RepID=UPI0025ADE3A5|nr:uncharacterized protein LOC131167383 [Malania oleifera]XP_057982169.1 uncharacterized protein LOC131167383 [Malania oleifera]XP_057982170.1 uncharacterized protein LOC131167383 [Malania oleifera]
MVLGLRTKNRRSPSVQVDYLIHVREIKPWPPSQSLRSLRSVLLQWENGERSSGSTSPVVPSLGSGTGDGKIEFNESFKIPVTLLRDMSIKGGDSDVFQKNCLEFNLYEPRRDKTVKGQLLGTAIIDLAEYGVFRESLSISAPMNCKRNFRNTAQPVLFINIQFVDKGRPGSLSKDTPQKEAVLDKNGGESVSKLMNEEYAEEAEVASFTDDDASWNSSVTVGSSNGGSPQNKENGSKTVMDCTGGFNKEHALTSKTETVIEPHENLKGSSSCSSIVDLSSDGGSPINNHDSSSSCTDSNLALFSQENVVHSFQSFSSSIISEAVEETSSATMKHSYHEDLTQEVHGKVPNGRSAISTNAQENEKGNMSNSSFEEAHSNTNSQMLEKLGFSSSADSQIYAEDNGKAVMPKRTGPEEAASATDINCGSMEGKDRKKEQESGKQSLKDENQSLEDEPLDIFSQDSARKQVSLGSDTLSFSSKNLGMRSNILNNDRLKHVKSVRSPLDSARSNGLVNSNQITDEVGEIRVPIDAQGGAKNSVSNERRDAKIYSKETKNTLSDGKIQQLEYRIKMLEGELREAAAIEVALYSVIAEHGSSMSKVHAPARRLSRLYLHACRESSQPRKASVARSAVSGLVLVAKACGNDVPRLTFWLSNSVMLRAIISRAIGKSQPPLSAGPRTVKNSGENGNNKRSAQLTWKESTPSKKENKRDIYKSFSDWEDQHAFTSGLEKVEAWIFSRIIESIWWQTLTPHMQSTAAKAIDRGPGTSSGKTCRRMPCSADQEQGNFSLDLWKKAFKDACERLCPVRAGGHECGCLPALTRLIMEQCVARLDVAMFNAILRESSDEIPTDPVSDPITDPRVLPVPSGKSSFGAGAQLKNAIGNWSRWLTDLFGIDHDDSFETENECDDDGDKHDTSFKSFHLLNALSDLMMLPKDMLLSRSIRKEVCPTFGAPLIRRVLSNFVPDEFCPDPIPEVVLEALDSEDSVETMKDVVADFPCMAAPAAYLPPSAASLAGILGESGSQTQLRRSGSSVLRKSYTSDDELDELDSPLTSIIVDSSRSSPAAAKPKWVSKENSGRNAVRYQLLREVWLNSD